jgi:chromosome segregation ATPase
LLRRYAPELLAAHVAGQFADADAQKRAEVDFRVALAESEERARTAKVRLSQAEEHLIRQEEAVCQVEEMVAAATERALILTKENEEAQRQIARLRRDAVTYDSRISALLSSEHALREQVATLRRREAERVSDPEGLEDIARQARNNLTEDDLDVLDRHRAALWDAGGARVGQPLSMALAVLTRLIRWKEAP